MSNLPAPETRPDVEAGLTRLFSAPAPDAAFVDRLERELRTRAAEQRPVRRSWLVASAGQRRVSMPSRARRLLSLGVLAFIFLALSVLAFPQARAAVAQWFGLTIEQHPGPYTVIIAVLRHTPLSDLPAYAYDTYTIPRTRWAIIKGAGFNTPQPGTPIMLPSGRPLLVPSYLPTGYEWQDAHVPNSSFLTFGYPLMFGGSGGGGGGRMPEYDQSSVRYLLGGDIDDHLLLLAQFQEVGLQGFSVRAFYVIPSATATAPYQTAIEISQESPVGAGPATPTPPPGVLENTHLQIGVIIEPKPGASGLSLAVGTSDVHATQVGSLEAWWYQGAWNSDGEWVGDAGLTTLVWRTDTDIYQLVTDAVALDELLLVAESLP